MIQGYITADGMLVLTGGTTTEQYALLAWLASYQKTQRTDVATLMVECGDASVVSKPRP